MTNILIINSFFFQKEIATLKEQVNKCKTFLNSLTNNTLWQEGSNSFTKNDLLVS